MNSSDDANINIFRETLTHKTEVNFINTSKLFQILKLKKYIAEPTFRTSPINFDYFKIDNENDKKYINTIF